jgi:hypothetical protein
MLALEDRLPPSEERNRVSAVVNMAIACVALGLPEDKTRTAFVVTIELLERLSDGRALTATLVEVVEDAVKRWESSPSGVRKLVQGVRLAYLHRKQRERAYGN